MKLGDLTFAEEEKTQEGQDTDVRETANGAAEPYDYYRCPPDFDLACQHAVIPT